MIFLHGRNADCLFSRLETDASRKREKHSTKKFALVAKVFCGHAYSTDLSGNIRRTSEP